MDDDENLLWFCCQCVAGGMRVEGHLSCPDCDHHRCDHCRVEYGNQRGEKPKHSKTRKRINTQQTTPSSSFTVKDPITPDPDSFGPLFTGSPRDPGSGGGKACSASICPRDIFRENPSSACAILVHSPISAPSVSTIDPSKSSDTCRRSSSSREKSQLKKKRVRKRKQSSVEAEPERSERFACLFYKHYPGKFNSRNLKFRVCSGPGYFELRHLKDHLENCHKGEDISEVQWNKIEGSLKTKKEKGKLPANVWSEWWNTLFPNELEPNTPHYDNVEGIPRASSHDMDDHVNIFERYLEIYLLQADLELDKMGTVKECAVHACRDMLRTALKGQFNKPMIKAFQSNEPVFSTIDGMTDTKAFEASTTYCEEPSLTVCINPKPCPEYVIAPVADFKTTKFEWNPCPTFDFGNRYHTITSDPPNCSSTNIETPMQLDGSQLQYQRVDEHALSVESVFPQSGTPALVFQNHPFGDYATSFQGAEFRPGTSRYEFEDVPPAVKSSMGFEVREAPYTEILGWNKNDDHNFFLGGPS